jgi:hypothetical protein
VGVGGHGGRRQPDLGREALVGVGPHDFAFARRFGLALARALDFGLVFALGFT